MKLIASFLLLSTIINDVLFVCSVYLVSGLPVYIGEIINVCIILELVLSDVSVVASMIDNSVSGPKSLSSYCLCWCCHSMNAGGYRSLGIFVKHIYIYIHVRRDMFLMRGMFCFYCY